MLGPLAIVVPILAVLADDEDDGADLEETFFRAIAFNRPEFVFEWFDKTYGTDSSSERRGALSRFLRVAMTWLLDQELRAKSLEDLKPLRDSCLDDIFRGPPLSNWTDRSIDVFYKIRTEAFWRISIDDLSDKIDLPDNLEGLHSHMTRLMNLVPYTSFVLPKLFRGLNYSSFPAGTAYNEDDLQLCYEGGDTTTADKRCYHGNIPSFGGKVPVYVNAWTPRDTVKSATPEEVKESLKTRSERVRKLGGEPQSLAWMFADLDKEGQPLVTKIQIWSWDKTRLIIERQGPSKRDDRFTPGGLTFLHDLVIVPRDPIL